MAVKNVVCHRFHLQPRHHSGMDHLVPQDLKEIRVNLVILEDRVNEVIVVYKERAATQDPRVRLDLQVLLVHKVYPDPSSTSLTHLVAQIQS